jgi:hypothetical protein
MKKFGLILGGCVMAFGLMFSGPDNVVLAKVDKNVVDYCGCPGTSLVGAEKNKIVAELLSSEAFKTAKKEWKEAGFSYLGAADIDVRILEVGTSEIMIIGVPLVSDDGGKWMAGFMEGVYFGPPVPDNH